MEVNGSPKVSGLKWLRCSVQNYDWGRIGGESGVARLYSVNCGAEIEEDKPYAEFWMGTHDSGPSFLAVQGVENGSAIGEENGDFSLKSWIERNPSVLGDEVVRKWGANLPFLFKVLSVAKALSIQAHPDKELARFLHKTNPIVYKDDNHKPEMALALTQFEALCGFISLQELKGVIRTVPEILDVVGFAYVEQVLNLDQLDKDEKAKEVLRVMFTELMSASKYVISEALSKLIGRLDMESKSRKLTNKEKLVVRLDKQYPDDVGVMAAFLFNYVKLNPGEALCIGPNELHAYIYGECIECMATSDNVVRAGLTPKNRDVQNLCSMLTYKLGYPEILQGVPINQYTKRYLPPFEEFEVDSCILPQEKSVIFPAISGPSIFLVTTGEGTIRMMTSLTNDEIGEGDVIFAPAGSETTIETNSGLCLYRAGVNSSRLFFKPPASEK